MRPFHLFPIVVLTGVLMGLVVQATVAQTSSTHVHTSKPARLKSPKLSLKPQPIGTFGDWTAATRVEAGQPECYSFTRPISSEPALPDRGDVFFTIAESAKLRDSVALTAGFVYPTGAEVAVNVGKDKFDFYSSGRSAFARDGAALIAAFGKGDDATVISPARKGTSVTDHFSLKGFSAAMKAVLAECPSK